MIRKLARILLWMLAALLGSGASLMAESHRPAENDTVLMFVGEDMEVLSIASRRQEGVWQAPAVGRVIPRKELWKQGVKTLSQALKMEPGFYMAQKEWGSEAYLRGIPDSALLLYDNLVPMGSDVTKTLQPLDYELSLAPVKRVEIVRGPGSVLWGPDAFAGIVNVVPMTGKDLDGAETGALYGGPEDHGALYVNMGKDGGEWDGFLSMSGRTIAEDDTPCNIVRFWGEGGRAYPYEERFGAEQPGRSHYLEASGNFSFRDWFTLSGLISDYKRPYAMSGPDESSRERDLTWPESRSGPFGFIKLEAKRDLDAVSGVRFAGYYNWLNLEYEIIDRRLDQRENRFYGELIYDRSFFAGKGVFTGGAAYRKTDVTNAPVWKSYFPDYVAQEKTTFLPLYTLEDYDDRLWSLFGQYTHSIGDFDFSVGLRNDDHRRYADALSYNAGVVWSPWPAWMFKALYGTAYRTPSARQLLGGDTPDLEEIETLNLQAGWKPSPRAEVNVCGFVSKIENHFMEDPYAGLSQPNHQKLYGVELNGRFSPLKVLDLSANLTLLNNSGPDETYRYIQYWDPDPHYEELNFPYDPGPKRLFNLTGTWRPHERVSIFARLGYHSATRLMYPRADTVQCLDGAWVLDMAATVRDMIFPGVDLQIAVRNLGNTHYRTAGTYSTISGEPFTAEVMLRKRW
ncbi:MAG: TonB-dependent receptor [Deltaproteobacteria bacterium]|nr:TonB-dependent receptor [Deltaproteobacteria bacterium]